MAYADAGGPERREDRRQAMDLSPGCWSPVSPTPDDQHAGNTGRAESRLGDQFPVERCQNHGVPRPGPPDDIHDRSHGRAPLELHLDNATIAGQREHFGERGYSLAPDAESIQLMAGEMRDATRPAGEADKRGIVENHGHAVTGHLHVELDAVDSEGQRPPEGGEGVFRRLGRGAAVGDEQRAGQGEPAQPTGNRKERIKEPGGHTGVRDWNPA